MKKIVSYIYSHTSPKLKLALGKSKLLKPLRDFAFRKDDSYRELKTVVKKKYKGHSVNFKFYASIQVATKASTKGIENTLLKHSLTLLSRIKPDKRHNFDVIDIGANFGYLSLVWAKTVSSKGRVISFEPHTKMCESFLKSIRANNLESVISTENYALGNKVERVPINHSTTTSNTLKASNNKNNITEVEMITLDHYMKEKKITSCDLIKIDVDGIELAILKGAENTIKTYRPMLIVELNGNENIIKFMEKLNYSTLNMKLQPLKKNEKLPSNAFFTSN